MGRIFKANAEQQAAYDQSVAVAEEQKAATAKALFIRDFLEFSNRATRDTGSALHSIGMHQIGKGLAIFQHNGNSRHIAMPTNEVPDRGLRLHAYKVVVGTEDFWTKGKPMGDVAVTGEVESGLIVGGTFPRLTGTEVILRVSSMPPSVHYRAEGDVLSPVEPATPAWSEMSELVATLMSKEVELGYKKVD